MHNGRQQGSYVVAGPDQHEFSNASRRMTGGRALAEMLRIAGIGQMFGMGGFQLLPFYEACRALGLRHSLVNDERSGAFAADAYAKVTNRPGCVDATLGPGATNLVTGLVESLNAGVPLIAITGDANREHATRNMTQETRQLEVLRPIVKEVIRVEVLRRIPEHVRRAFTVATSGRPGPVLIDVPEDIAHGEHDFETADFWIDARTTTAQSRRFRPDPADTELARRLLEEAERPLILAGGGVHISAAHDALRKLAESMGIPVAHTMTGKGAIACTHPLSAGLFGRYDRIANQMIAESDCLLVVGCKLGEIATKRFSLIPPGKPLIHIEIDPTEISRTTETAVALAGDARLALQDLAGAMADGGAGLARRADWIAEVPGRMAAWREGAGDRLLSQERPINIGRLMHELNEVMPADGIVVADGGFAAHWAGLLFDTKEAGRHFLPDRGFASIGYGLPGGIGAQLAAGPARRIVALTGDGGFNMSLGELETARRIGANLVVVVFNNAASGYVKALQHAVYGEGSYQSSDLVELDYAAIARAFGCLGIRVEDPGKVSAALMEGLANTSTPTVIDVVVTRDPAKMLPAADNRALKVGKGDRPV
jgi:acetolactate synthase-1/2/3 large subunit